jgi:hypothetical protein
MVKNLSKIKVYQLAITLLLSNNFTPFVCLLMLVDFRIRILMISTTKFQKFMKEYSWWFCQGQTR